MVFFIVYFFIAYLLGSISSAILLCRCTGQPDPRAQGSGNPGASNILRIAGKKMAATVLLLDILKGWLPVMIANKLGMPITMSAWVLFFSFLGHLFPIFFQFRGGKGVATALGGLLALCWPIAVFTSLVWLLVFFMFRYISVASILAAIATLVVALVSLPLSVNLPIFCVSTLLVARHHANIARLRTGAEPKLRRTPTV